MIRIVTDSACDLPDEVLKRHRISVVPLTIRFGDSDFLDGVELTTDSFWDRLVTSDEHPETAAPSIGKFQETFTSLVSEGADGIAVLTMSSAISATHQSAALAADQFSLGVPVRVVDTRLVSAALGLTVLQAAELAESGSTLDAVVSMATNSYESTNLFAALDTVEYLKRGGRIGPAKAFFGNLLDVRPLISFSEGEVAAAGRVRTRKKSVTAVIDHVKGLADELDKIAIVHSAPEEVGDFTKAVADVVGETPMVAELGPVVGTHAGPGVLGVVYRVHGSD